MPRLFPRWSDIALRITVALLALFARRPDRVDGLREDAVQHGVGTRRRAARTVRLLDGGHRPGCDRIGFTCGNLLRSAQRCGPRSGFGSGMLRA
jgi:hypothetical protein